MKHSSYYVREVSQSRFREFVSFSSFHDKYRLADLLFREARLSSLNCKLLGQGCDIQRQQTKFIKLEEELFGLWEQHNQGELETLELLALAANLYAKQNNKITKLLR